MTKRIIIVAFFVLILKTSFTVDINDSIIENSEPHPSASIIIKKRTENNGAISPNKLIPILLK